jgi:thiol-disulfide isomerase/thioredoxin
MTLKFRLKVFTVLLFTLSYSCSNNNKPTGLSEQSVNISVPTVVSGYLINVQDNRIVFVWGNRGDTLFADENHQFETTVYLSQADYVVMKNSGKNIRLYLMPGDSLELSFDAANVYESLSFEGKASLTNNYLKHKYQLLLQHSFSGSHRFELPVKEFRHLSDSLYVVEKLFLEDYAAQNPSMSESFLDKEQAALLYDWASQLMEYPRMNQVNANINDEKYFKFLNKVSVNETQYLSLYEYRQFLNAYIAWFTQQQMDAGANREPATHEVSLMRMQQVNRRIMNPEVKDYLLASILKEQIRYFGYKNTETLFQIFDLNCSSDSIKKIVMERYQQYMALKAKPDAPQVLFTDILGKNTQMTDLKGSYLYIDVWATWCLPCKKEAPYFEKLKQQYAHKNIRFIGLSVDEKQADWQEYLQVRPSEYEQFWIPDAKPFLDAYLIKTIPHFLIIDPDGKLINPNAFRPSEPDLDWFENLPNMKSV